VSTRNDHYPVCRLDIWQDSEFSTGYRYPKTAFKREPDTDPGIRNAFIDISRIQTFGKSCTLRNQSFITQVYNFKWISWGLGSGIASPKIWGGKIFDFRRITLFCLKKRLSKQNMTMFSKNLGGMAPLAPHWLRLWDWGFRAFLG